MQHHKKENSKVPYGTSQQLLYIPDVPTSLKISQKAKNRVKFVYFLAKQITLQFYDFLTKRSQNSSLANERFHPKLVGTPGKYIRCVICVTPLFVTTNPWNMSHLIDS